MNADNIIEKIQLKAQEHQHIIDGFKAGNKVFPPTGEVITHLRAIDDCNCAIRIIKSLK